MEDFEYRGIKLRHVEKHNDKCDGCYLWEEDIPCVPKECPECKTGIFIKVEEDDSQRIN